MPDQTKRYQCRHIFTDGHRCGSPSLRREALCYYHHTTRKPAPHPTQQSPRQTEFTLPLPEDRSAIQLAIGQVLQRIAANEIDPKRAGLLLYGLQIASLNLPREAANKNRTQAEEPTQVEEIIEDPTYGPLAPEAELAETKRKSIIRILLENLKDEAPEEVQTHQEAGCPIPSAPNRAQPTEPNILPEIQAAAATPQPTQTCRSTNPSEKSVRTPNLNQKVEAEGHQVALCLRSSLKRKAVDDRAVANPPCVRGPNVDPHRTQIASSSS